jgi:hypothetical protein
MLPKVDIIGKIQQLYMEKRPVPYLTFIHVFNELLEDPAKMVPKKPSADLREQLRAACMAVNVGILDTEGREEGRIREFREKIYPAWQAALPREEMAKYDAILRGTLREKRQPRAYEKEAVAVAEGHDRSRELLKRLGLVEVAAETPGVQPRAAKAGAAEAAQEAMPPVPEFDNVDNLCEAIRAGELKARYAPRGKEAEFARYKLEGFDVAVKLAAAGESRYAVLTVGVGRATVLNARERIETAAAEMRYARMSDFAYLRRDDEFVCTLTVGPNSMNLACSPTQAGADDDIIRRITLLHRDIGELVERLR